MSTERFRNYQTLLEKIDTFHSRIMRRYRREIACQHGCTECCQQALTLFPLEFFYLREGFSLLPADVQAMVRSRPVQATGEKGRCVLLHQGGCLLYTRRPVICRTHGLPLVIPHGSGEQRDCCPKNFIVSGLTSLPPEDLLEVERLTTILVAVNCVFASQSGIEAGLRLPLGKLSDRRFMEAISFSP